MDRPALLLTRPAESARTFIDRLDPDVLRGVTVCISPLLRIAPLDVHPDLDGFRSIIFTSANGADMAPLGEGRAAACVGDRTALAAQARGWDVRRVARTADDLVQSLLEEPMPQPLLHISGQHRRGEIAQRLSEAGQKADVIAIYDQELIALTDTATELLMADRPVIVPLFSPRTARQFMRSASDLRRVSVVAISDAVAERVDRERVTDLQVVDVPTSDAMQQTVEMLLRQDSLP